MEPVLPTQWTPVGSRLKFSCDENTLKLAYDEVICTGDERRADWKPPLPQCTRMSLYYAVLGLVVGSCPCD